MNPRQRRGLLLIAIAALGLVVVFVLIAGYVSDVRKEVDPKVQLLSLAKPVEAHRRSRMTWSSRSRCRSAGPRRARCATRDSSSGSSPGPTWSPRRCCRRTCSSRRRSSAPGQRELAILVDAETGVAGKIGPDSVVDVIATYPGGETEAPESRVVVPNARIIEVGQPRLKGGRGVQEQAADPAQVVPVTFALEPEQALVVSYAESNATEVRLALLRPGSRRS